MSSARGAKGRGTCTEKKITKQIEFYFSDLNLATDILLLPLVNQNDGWISLEFMLTFNRLRRLTSEPTEIVRALTRTKCRLIEINKAKTHIRRSPDFPIIEITQEMWKEIGKRTLFCDGLPKELTFDNLVDKFQPFDEILLVRPRFYYDNETSGKTFKGSVFLIFTSLKAAATFLNAKYKKCFGRQEPRLIWRDEYKAEQSKMRRQQNQ